MLHLDANFFIFALLDNTERGVKGRRIQRSIVKGEEGAITSSLALDEIMWVLLRNKKQRLLRIAIEGIYLMPYLDAVRVSSTTPLLALDIMEKYNLKPRDALHVAVMKENGVKAIVSNDKDFDKVE